MSAGMATAIETINMITSFRATSTFPRAARFLTTHCSGVSNARLNTETLHDVNRQKSLCNDEQLTLLRFPALITPGFVRRLLIRPINHSISLSLEHGDREK